MAARFGGTSRLYQRSFTPFTTANTFTLIAHYLPGTVGSNHIILSVNNNAGAHCVRLSHSGTSTTAQLVNRVSADTAQTAVNSVLASGRWTSLVGSQRSSTDRTLTAKFVDTGRPADTSTTTNSSPGSLTGVSIGGRDTTDANNEVSANSLIVHAAVLTRGLTLGEQYRILNGEWLPDVVEDRSIGMWFPLDTNFRCNITGIDMTVAGTVTIDARHPRYLARKSASRIGWSPALESGAALPIDLTGVGSVVDGATATLTCTDAGASAGTVQLAGTLQDIVSWSNTEIQFTVDRGNAKYGGVTIIATTAGATSSDSIVGATLTPASGADYTDLSGTLATSGVRITALPDIESGDQLHYYGVVGGGVVTVGEAGVLINSDGTFTADDWVTGFYVEANDGVWGTPAFQTVGSGETSAPSNLSLTLRL